MILRIDLLQLNQTVCINQSDSPILANMSIMEYLYSLWPGCVCERLSVTVCVCVSVCVGVCVVVRLTGVVLYMGHGHGDMET